MWLQYVGQDSGQVNRLWLLSFTDSAILYLFLQTFKTCLNNFNITQCMSQGLKWNQDGSVFIKNELLYRLQFVNGICLHHFFMFVQLPQLRPGAGIRTALPRLPHGALALGPAAEAFPWGSLTPTISVSLSKSLAFATCGPAKSTSPNTSR